MLRAQTDTIVHDPVLSQQLEAVTAKTMALESQYKSLHNETVVLKRQCSELQAKHDSLLAALGKSEQKTQELSSQLEGTDCTVQANEAKRQHTVLWGIIVAMVLAVASVVAWVLLRKRINKKGDDIELLRARADELNQQMVERMDKELAELQTIANNIKTAQQPSATQQPSTTDAQAEPDHSLVKALAYGITRIEVNLYGMNSDVHGYNQLKKAVQKMKDNLLASGYEIIEMLGTEYSENMTLKDVKFKENPEIAGGKQIITRVIQPQINYRGKAIQFASIEVSENNG